MRRSRFQQGSLQLIGRAGSRKAWEYRWYEVQPDGSRVRRNLVLGTLDHLPNETAAQKAVAALRADINAESPRMNMAPISIQTLVEHYVQKELGEDSSKTYAKLFYVAASRGRQEITVITSDREQLRESLGISTARSSVMELARSLAHEHDSRVRDAAQNPATHLERSTPHYREIACDHSLGMGL